MADDGFEAIEYKLQERVAIITLNRPDSLNAFNGRMAEDLKRGVGRAVSDRQVRAIVITGAGRAFCSGADVRSISAGTPIAGDPEIIQALDAHFAPGPGPDVSAAVRQAERLGYFIRAKKPIIAAINGVAAGLGLLIALYSDVRFASSEAYLMTAMGQRGLIAEHGMAWLLSRSIGMANAMDMLISSRRVKAEEARSLGLVTYVTPPDELLRAALAYAGTIATTMSPRAVAVMKAQTWQANLESFATALSTALEETHIAGRHADVREGASAFVEKRAPQFADV